MPYHEHKYEVNSGVKAVANPNIEMFLDEYGIYRHQMKPDIQDRDHTSELDRLVDSMADESLNESEIAKGLFGGGQGYNDTIGHYTGLYAGHVVVGDYRANGSSGGLTTWLLVKLLEEDMIDGVIHFTGSGVSDTVLFRYTISRTIEEIKNGAKSRYYPGELSEVLFEAIEDGQRYAVTGIPSFITELRLLARINPEVAENIKFYIGLICGHQKSTKYAEALAWEYGIRPGNLHSINFRKKNPTGKSSEYFTEMTGTTTNGVVTISKPHSEPFVSDWGHGFFKPTFSDYTDDAFNETADVALGDAWLPEYAHDGLGDNVAITRNPTIDELIQKGIQSGELRLDVIDEETMIRSQRGLVHHTRDEIGYRLDKVDRTGKWRPTKRIQPSEKLPFWRKRVQDVREAIATKSHIAYEEAVAREDWSYFEHQMRPLLRRYQLLYWILLVSKTPPRIILKKSLGVANRMLKPRMRRD